MGRRGKSILTFLLLGLGLGTNLLTSNTVISVFHAPVSGYEPEHPADMQAPQNPTPVDTTPRYPVSKTVVEEYEDIIQQNPVDLRNPDNLQSTFEYDPLTNTYVMRTKIGDSEVITPYAMTPEEYLEYTMQQSLQDYFRQRNRDEFLNQDKEQTFSPFDMNFELGPADKLFGPGGVQLQANGSVDVKMGITRNYSGDPTLSETNRVRTAFDFDQQIQANVKAKVGDKVNFDLNYNTETTFDYDSKKLKLAYQGKEDEILQLLEAGNVSMTTSNSLINGGAALFGIKTDLQFGKLKVSALFSQQESQSKTVSSKRGVQTSEFEITADDYDENQHFFLSHYFREKYDYAMSTLPYIRSNISITKIEVWITNSRNYTEDSRNIIAFSDLGEPSYIHNIAQAGTNDPSGYPYNNVNKLYNNLNAIPNLRDISQATSVLAANFTTTVDYEKIENARKLSESEYTLNAQLGYISLRSKLQANEVLAVAYSYTINGDTYQVGEFSTDRNEYPSQSMYLKLLKGTSMNPDSPFWHLMMKNVYSLNAYSVQKEDFKLNIFYQNDTTGTYVQYITEGKIANQLLLRVMNLDRLDSRNNTNPDGIFDFVEGYTILPQTGKVIFPVVQPFGEHLRAKIGNDNIADKYVFQELYDSTLTVARQTAEKNKFILRGEYRGSGASNGDIDLGAYNVARGSVRVTSNGQLLTENVDYTVDYLGGTVTLMQHIADSGAPVSVSLENQSMYGMQRKTLMGLNLEYHFSPDFNIGGTIMNLREMPITTKVNMGEESVNNTLYGFNMNYRTESQWLTDMVDKLPLLDLTAPSQINFSAEFAQLLPGHYKSKYGGDYSYIDDFERTKITYDLRTPSYWFLASTPAEFPEGILSNNVDYGKNRALLNWFTIDGLFTRKKSSLTPTHIKNDKEQLSNHYVRQIDERELYPAKDMAYDEVPTISTLNLAFYPKERGPYNLDGKNVNPATGELLEPENRWGGIMRKMDSGQIDFEAANIEYIEFWLLDPFIYNENSDGGNLFINLGEISEDILKDGRKFYENGLPVDGDMTAVDTTKWGKVPNRSVTNYAFAQTTEQRLLQDVGLNGLSTQEEFIFPEYANYLQDLRNTLQPDVIARMEQDPFSPFNDPASDNYHHFRGSDYDREERSILYRYKRYNGTEGNSTATETDGESYVTSAKVTPDVEDINQDYTLNETEKYFSYNIELNPERMNVGENFIVSSREAEVTLRNDKREKVTWYQFKVPIHEYTDKYGNPRDFKTVRFMRMYLTNFTDSVVLRFGSLNLVRGGWRTYTHDLSEEGVSVSGTGSIDVTAVNIEENSSREPVNYVLPPGVSRILDPGQTQLIQQNEQAMSIRIHDLEKGDARAVYQSAGLDTRQYKRMQMFVHAEKLIDDQTNLQDNELSVFLRLGSDYKNNYYEYEIPLVLTPHGRYSSYNYEDQLAVWPTENMFDFQFEILTNLKLERNRQMRDPGSGVTYTTPYYSQDPNNQRNQIAIVGNPSLSNTKVIMIGVRNRGNGKKSGEIWVNELRVTEFNEDGGWAANANLNVALSDLGTVNFAGRIETAGFGSIEQGVMDRSMEDFFQYNISANVQLGRLFPDKAKVAMPMYYTYSKEVTTPEYDPFNEDIKLSESLALARTKTEKDSIKRLSEDKIITKSISFNNVKVGIRSENPMPWDPDNFAVSFSFAENKKYDPATEYEWNLDQRLGLSYGYSPFFKPFAPFKNNKSKAGHMKFLKDFSLNYLPTSITFNTELTRRYYEIQLRDLNNLGGENFIPVSFSEEFYWNRNASLQWNLTKNLNMSLQTGTQARIETHQIQANKQANNDAYKHWKDSVWQSITDFGTPIYYGQTFNASYNLPFKLIPVLDFISASATYTASYNWDKGSDVETGEDEEPIRVYNTISNARDISLNNVNINLLNLYNKSDFLKKTNQKFTMRRPAANAATRNRNQTRENNATARERRKYETEITLNTDSATVVNHRLNNKRIRVTARKDDGRLYELKFKALDNNSIRINTKDTVKLNLTINQLPPQEETTWYKVAQVTARGAMMVRSFGFSYTRRDAWSISNFIPDIGDALGQTRTGGQYAPGLDFAFGFTDENYLNKISNRGWLYTESTENSNPAKYETTETFNFRASLEPATGLKIDLTAYRSTSDNQKIYFTQDPWSTVLGGSFSMTTIAIKTAFQGSKAENSYHSKAFEEFLSNRNVIRERLHQVYFESGMTYPNGGFIAKGNGGLAGQPVSDMNGTVSLNSSDVLIPAFIAAYTGKNAGSIDITAFPSLKSILPNWKITYEGLRQLPVIDRYFKSFVLSHDYNCRYTVGTFSSYQGWVQAEDGLGFIEEVTSGNPTPSSPYDISGVTINESFNPLIGLNATFQNNMTMRLEWRTTRNLNLNISSYQIIESTSDNFIIGTGYKVADFNKVVGLRPTGSADFSNDLTVSADFSYQKMQSINRKIQEGYSQGTSGDIQTTIKISAAYNLSRLLTCSAFFDRLLSKPLVSSTAFPCTTTSFGISMSMKLSR